MQRGNVEERKKEVIEFLKKNPRATHRQLKEAGFFHMERLFKGCLGGAYKEAGLKPPRTFEKKTRAERKAIIISYIKKHPNTGGQHIQKDTKINIKNAFNNTQEAFEAAGVPYPRKEFVFLLNRTRKEKQEAIIKLVKNNPETTFGDIAHKLQINPFRIFKNFDEIYQLAGMAHISGTRKRALKKRKAVIEFIKNNKFATQREINKTCETRIQGLFERGIFGAYKEAGVNFPFKRLNFHGSALKEVRKRAKNFEEEIARKLSCYGNVQRLVNIKRGVADIVLERKGKKIVVEVKDYLNKEVSKHEIKQLNKYLEDYNANLGLLICHTKPKKDRFIINENKIVVLESTELDKVPEILDSGV